MTRVAAIVLFFLVLTGFSCATDLPAEETGVVVEKDIHSGRASGISGDTPDQYILRLDNGEGHTFIVSFGDSLWAYEEWQRIQLGYLCEAGDKKGFTKWHCEAQTEQEE